MTTEINFIIDDKDSINVEQNGRNEMIIEIDNLKFFLSNESATYLAEQINEINNLNNMKEAI